MRWRVAVVQLNMIAGDPEANRAKAGPMLEEAAAGADLLVLPELWTTGYALADLPRLAEREDGPTASLLSDLARRQRCHVVGGSVAIAGEGRLYNQALVFDATGRRLGAYRKVHLFAPMGEKDCFAAGEDLTPFVLDGMPCGVLICYDLRFPEAARRLALGGARVLFYVAQWPRERREHWRTLLLARAIENQCFVVGANAAGTRFGEEFAGGSLVIDPRGRVLAEGGAGEETVRAAIDPAALEESRRLFSVLEDRMPQVYEP